MTTRLRGLRRAALAATTLTCALVTVVVGASAASAYSWPESGERDAPPPGAKVTVATAQITALHPFAVNAGSGSSLGSFNFRLRIDNNTDSSLHVGTAQFHGPDPGDSSFACWTDLPAHGSGYCPVVTDNLQVGDFQSGVTRRGTLTSSAGDLRFEVHLAPSALAVQLKQVGSNQCAISSAGRVNAPLTISTCGTPGHQDRAKQFAVSYNPQTAAYQFRPLQSITADASSCVDTYDRRVSQGAPAVTNTCGANAASQQWTWTPSTTDPDVGTLTQAVSTAAGTARVLDTAYGNTAPGTYITIGTPVPNSKTQQWQAIFG